MAAKSCVIGNICGTLFCFICFLVAPFQYLACSQFPSFQICHLVNGIYWTIYSHNLKSSSKTSCFAHFE